MEAVLSHIENGDIPAEVEFVLSNNSKAVALETAHNKKIPVYHISSKTEGSQKACEEKILALVRDHKLDLVILAGYMKKIPPQLVEIMPHKIVNIHPALLPAFGGDGWYGHYIHEGVLKRGCQFTGITIHTVNEHYDEGKIIWQRVLGVKPEDNAESLAKRVLKLEHDSLWRVVDAFARGQLKSEGPNLAGVDSFLHSQVNATVDF